MIRRYKINLLIMALAMFLISGCYQGRPSKNEPIHLNPNMDHQQKVRPQSESGFYADGSGMRIPPAGTVARGQLQEDVEYYTGKDENGNFVKGYPEQVNYNLDLILRGQNRFDIYCSPCHGRVGNGKGIVPARGMLPPPSFHEERILKFDEGQIFDVISNGVRNMPPYKFQIPVEDRWAIISYFRTLQRSQNATINDIPENMRDQVK